ncbi:DUF4030 domain-containing protein [Fictibacillus iocasae]|uniref:DUF4030 domain-containing protein n=1 Tax=Fictibacillus iocasae TaxID=2715437 RepID=A0ABW2NPC5_9BACL
MEDKLNHLEKMMKTTVLREITFDQKLKNRISNELQKKKSVRKPINKVMGTAIAAAVIIGSFFTAVNISPAFAETVSKLPLLSLMFHEKDPVQLVHEELREKKYNIDAVGVTYQPKKEMMISIVGSDQYYRKVKYEVEKIAESLLAKNGLDAYRVKVYQSIEYVDEPQSPEWMQWEKDAETLRESIKAALAKAGISVRQVDVNTASPDLDDKRVQIEIVDTEKRVPEIKSLIRSTVKDAGFKEMPIEVYKINLAKQEQEGRWSDILSAISVDLMGKKDYRVTGLGYSVHPSPRIEIRTEVKSTDPDAESFARDLHNKVIQFLQEDEMKKKVRGDDYKIEILSRDKKIISE